ncbi:MAG: ABC transporter substrate-binding protein [Synergistaceae bacterium]|nr:ABC transporter substrate-binding protein [Synergistaceae bacterium]
MYLRDDVGADIVVGFPARRIISLYAGHTENLAAMGAGDFVVAVGRSDDGAGNSVAVLGARPGIEQIVALSPDLILTRPMLVRASESLYSALRSFGVVVVALDPPSWDEFPEYIDRMAALTGLDSEPGQEALRLIRSSERSELEEAPGALLVTNGRTMSTCTPDSWAAHVLAASGFRNVARSAPPAASGSVIAAFGAERTIAANDDIDVILLQQGAMNTVRAVDFMNDTRFAGLEAVRNGMVFDVPEADVSRPSLLRMGNEVLRSIRERVTAGGVER